MRTNRSLNKVIKIRISDIIDSRVKIVSLNHRAWQFSCLFTNLYFGVHLFYTLAHIFYCFFLLFENNSDMLMIRNLPKFYHKSFLIFCQNYDKSFLTGGRGVVCGAWEHRQPSWICLFSVSYFLLFYRYLNHGWKRRIDGSNVIERVSTFTSTLQYGPT